MSTMLYEKNGVPMVTIELGEENSTRGTFTYANDGKTIDIAIQCIDYYGYQRELSLKWTTHLTKDGSGIRSYVLSVYKHPFRPPVQYMVSDKVARKMNDRLVASVTQYPKSLFNDDDGFRGFVHMTDALLAGVDRPSLVVKQYA